MVPHSLGLSSFSALGGQEQAEDKGRNCWVERKDRRGAGGCWPPKVSHHYRGLRSTLVACCHPWPIPPSVCYV